MKNSITFIVPNYNAGPLLKRCIDSIYSQLSCNDFLIVIDDKSSDDSLSYVAEYLSKDNFLLIKHDINMGVSVSRNDGLKNTNTDLVTFIDSDDEIKNNYVEFIKENFSDNTHCLSFGFNYIDITMNTSFLKNTTIKPNMSFIEKVINLETSGLMSSCCNKVYSTKIIKNNNLEFNCNAKVMEDYEFNISYFSNIDSFDGYNIAFYNYYYNGEVSASSKYQENLLSRFFEIKKIREKFYKKYNMDDSIIGLNSSFLIICLNNLYKKDCNLSKKERISLLKKIIKLDEFKYIKTKKNKSLLEKLISIFSISNSVLILDFNLKIAHFIKYHFKFCSKIFRKKNNN